MTAGKCGGGGRPLPKEQLRRTDSHGAWNKASFPGGGGFFRSSFFLSPKKGNLNGLENRAVERNLKKCALGGIPIVIPTCLGGLEKYIALATPKRIKNSTNLKNNENLWTREDRKCNLGGTEAETVTSKGSKNGHQGILLGEGHSRAHFFG